VGFAKDMKVKKVKDTKDSKDSKVSEQRRSARVAGNSNSRKYKIGNKIKTNYTRSESEIKKSSRAGTSS